MKTHTFIILFLIISTCLVSCRADWLDAKPSKSLVDANSLEDFQAILDNNATMNKVPGLAELSADNFFLQYGTWLNSTSTLQKNIYTWADDIYGADIQNPDWTNAYARILIANIVLDKINKWEGDHSATPESEAIKASALFFRSLDFYNLAQLFCMPFGFDEYNQFGLPLRLNPNVNDRASRQTVSDTYTQIISDLKAASLKLPLLVSHKTRPSKAAAYGLLSRVYLSMGEYVHANNYADSCLALTDGLLDYKTLAATPRYPIVGMNKEVIFHAELAIYTLNYGTAFNVDTALYGLYDDSDTRKTLFFQLAADGVKFRGSYTGAATLFGGIATNEIYFIRAETRLRQGNVEGAKRDLHDIFQHRLTNGTINLDLLSEDQLLEMIQAERRKELLFRGLRWTDLRRLNLKHPLESITLKRVLDGDIYTLEPNSPRYMVPIPLNELGTNEMDQNPR